MRRWLEGEEEEGGMWRCWSIIQVGGCGDRAESVKGGEGRPGSWGEV